MWIAALADRVNERYGDFRQSIRYHDGLALPG